MNDWAEEREVRCNVSGHSSLLPYDLTRSLTSLRHIKFIFSAGWWKFSFDCQTSSPTHSNNKMCNVGKMNREQKPKKSKQHNSYPPHIYKISCIFLRTVIHLLPLLWLSSQHISKSKQKSIKQKTCNHYQFTILLVSNNSSKADNTLLKYKLWAF